MEFFLACWRKLKDYFSSHIYGERERDKMDKHARRAGSGHVERQNPSSALGLGGLANSKRLKSEGMQTMRMFPLGKSINKLDQLM